MSDQYAAASGDEPVTGWNRPTSASTRRYARSPTTALPPMKSLTAESGSPARAAREVDCILVFQGGGALGAYQAGVFESLYWDGGLVSNTPLQYVLDQPGMLRRIVFQVDLFAAAGALPGTLCEVDEREKDIRFSSRTRLNTRVEVERQQLAQAAQRLLGKLPPELRDDPDARVLAALRPELGVDVVHLIYRGKHREGRSKDYEFSRLSMEEHWASGRADMARTLQDPRWTGRAHAADGVRVHDLTPAG